MRLVVSNRFPVDADIVWDAITSPAFLAEMVEPLLKMEYQGDAPLPERWEVGMELTFGLKLATLVPLGQQKVRCVKNDARARVFATKESGTLVRHWDHVMSVTPDGPGRCVFTDRLQIDAGILTTNVWMFGHALYRYRQKRMKWLLGRIGLRAIRPGTAKG